MTIPLLRLAGIACLTASAATGIGTPPPPPAPVRHAGAFLGLTSRDQCEGSGQAAPFAPELAERGRLYRGTLTPDGRTLYFFKKVTPGQEDYRIFRSQDDGSRWSAPERVVLGSGEHSDLYPALSADGRRLVFSSYRPLPGADSAAHNAHLWYADRQGSGWGTPRPITAANRPGHYHPGPVIGARGEIRFKRLTPDYRVDSAFVSEWRSGQYQPARPADDPVTWATFRPDYRYWGATYSKDRRLAILGFGRRDPLTGRTLPTDLWFSRAERGGWSDPRPLGAGVNTSGDEGFPFFAPDGCTLVFTRDYTSFQRVSLAAAVSDTTSLPPLWSLAPGEVSTRGIEGSYRGAFVRNGSVQLVDADIGSRRDSLLIALTSPDRPTGRVAAPIQRDSTGQLSFRTWNGPAKLTFDSINGELFGSVGTASEFSLHLRRMAAPPRVEVAREELTFTSAGATIAGTLIRPVGIPVRAAIVFVPGRGCATREGGLRWLETLAQYGIGGIAADKRGSGRSGGNCRFGTIDEFTQDAVASLAELKKRFNTDSTRFGFWGTSAGGWVVVRAQALAAVDFLITSAGPATSVQQQQHDNTTYITRRLGYGPGATARAHRYIDLMFEKEATPARFDEMMATVRWARDTGFAQEFFEDSDIPSSVAGLDSLWVALNNYDPGPDLARLRIPMLAFFGERDEVVPPAENVAALRKVVAGNAGLRIVVVPDGSHGLGQPGGMRRLSSESQYWRFDRTSPLIVEEILAFLRRR